VCRRRHRPLTAGATTAPFGADQRPGPSLVLIAGRDLGLPGQARPLGGNQLVGQLLGDGDELRRGDVPQLARFRHARDNPRRRARVLVWPRSWKPARRACHRLTEPTAPAVDQRTRGNVVSRGCDPRIRKEGPAMSRPLGGLPGDPPIVRGDTGHSQQEPSSGRQPTDRRSAVESSWRPAPHLQQRRQRRPRPL
jgi:hypothetical protein